MSKLLLKWLVTALSLLLVAEIIPGIVVESFAIAAVAAFVFGIVNVTIKPVLYILTFPINILTLGLFSFVLNAFFFYLVSTFVNGFLVEGFWSAVLGAIIVSLLASTVDLGGGNRKKHD